MQYIIYYPLYKLLKKYLSIKVWQILQKELQIWNATLITGVTCFNIEIIKKEIWEVKKNVTTLKMETFSAYEHEIPILSSYTERGKRKWKGNLPWSQLRFIKASQNTCILKPLSDAHNDVPGSEAILRPLSSPYYIQARHVTSTYESRYFCLRDFKNTEMKYQM